MQLPAEPIIVDTSQLPNTMLKVELELPAISCIAFCGSILFIPPAGLAILLSAKHYTESSLQVAAALVGAFSLCLAFGTFLVGVFPHRWTTSLIYFTLAALSTVSGLYWASARFNSPVQSASLKYEIACLCLWACSLMFSWLLLGIEFMALLANTQQIPAEKLPDSELYPDFGEIHSDFTKSPSFHVSHKKSVSSLMSLGRIRSHKTTEKPGNPLAGLEALPEGFPEADWDAQSVDQDRVKWILAQAMSQSRNVSDSSNLTGTLFPATDYNRRISDMGFQKDEAVPLPKVRKQSSFPQSFSEQKSRSFKSA